LVKKTSSTIIVDEDETRIKKLEKVFSNPNFDKDNIRVQT